MSIQSDRESFDKRIAHLVAHRTPDELAKELLNLQDANAQNAAEQANTAPVEPGPPEARGFDEAVALKDDNPLDDDETTDDEDLPRDDR